MATDVTDSSSLRKVAEDRIGINSLGEVGDRRHHSPSLMQRGGDFFRTERPAAFVRGRRKTRVIKSKLANLKLTVGEEGIDQAKVVGLIDCALVGRIEHIKINYAMLNDWVKDYWKPILKYLPRFSFMVNGWIIFHLLSVADRQKIEQGIWIIGSGSLVLTRWYIGFNPLHERIRVCHLWVILRGYPIQLWSRHHFVRIGNLLGRFVFLENSMLFDADKRCARILVEFDTTAGLPECMEIEWRGSSFIQELDYLFVPFRCHLCHKTGHLARQCLASIYHSRGQNRRASDEDHLVEETESERSSTAGDKVPSPVSVHSSPPSGKVHSDTVPYYGDLSLDVIAYIAELDNFPVALTVDDPIPSLCHTVDVVGSPTVILDSSDSEDSDCRDVTHPIPMAVSSLCGGNPITDTVSSFSTSPIAPLINETGTEVPTAPPDSSSPVSSVDCTGPSVSTDSQHLMASYRDILLAHLPTFTDHPSTKPGVEPLRFRDVSIRRLKRWARGSGSHIGPDTAETVDGYIPLSVRLEMASVDLTSGALRDQPLSPGSK